MLHTLAELFSLKWFHIIFTEMPEGATSGPFFQWGECLSESYNGESAEDQWSEFTRTPGRASLLPTRGGWGQSWARVQNWSWEHEEKGRVRELGWRTLQVGNNKPARHSPWTRMTLKQVSYLHFANGRKHWQKVNLHQGQTEVLLHCAYSSNWNYAQIISLS